MNTRRTVVAAAALAVAVAGAPAASAADPSLPAMDQPIGTHRLLSMRADGSHTTLASQRGVPSADGRFVAFWSGDREIIGGETFTTSQIIRLDRESGTNLLVSRGIGAEPGNEPSNVPSISGDGTKIAFQSWATNLARQDTNVWQDVFVSDTAIGTTLVTWSYGEGDSAEGSSVSPVISADGRWVAFESDAQDLVPGVDGPGIDVFRYDTLTRALTVVSVGPGGSPGAGAQPAISADGRFVAFSSTAPLVRHDRNGREDVFVRDLKTGRTSLISVSSEEIQGEWGSARPAISPDGRFVTFETMSTNLGYPDDLSTPDVFVRDRRLGTTRLASIAPDGSGGAWASGPAPVSIDGTVYLSAFADGLVEGDDNGHHDIFLSPRDAPLSKITFSQDGGATNGASLRPVLSASGNYLVYDSWATNIADDPYDDFDVFGYRIR